MSIGSDENQAEGLGLEEECPDSPEVETASAPRCPRSAPAGVPGLGHGGQPWLLDHAEDRRLGCLMTVHAQSPRHALDRLSRLLSRTRPAPGAAELTDAAVFARSPAAVWKVLDPAA